MVNYLFSKKLMIYIVQSVNYRLCEEEILL